jgi:hypothetical protein
MHGAWVFDLVLLFFTGTATVLAFRQIVTEREGEPTPDTGPPRTPAPIIDP